MLNEGQFAQVVCIVTQGDEPLTITWSLQGEIVSSEPGLSTTTLGTRTSMLTIQSVGYRHSGLYTCTAKNKAGYTSKSVELKVKGEDRTKCEKERWTGNEVNMFGTTNAFSTITFQNHLRLLHSRLEDKRSMRETLPRSLARSTEVMSLLRSLGVSREMLFPLSLP